MTQEVKHMTIESAHALYIVDFDSKMAHFDPETADVDSEMAHLEQNTTDFE